MKILAGAHGDEVLCTEPNFVIFRLQTRKLFISLHNFAADKVFCITYSFIKKFKYLGGRTERWGFMHWAQFSHISSSKDPCHFCCHSWISISSYKYFQVVRIEKQIHLFIFWEKLRLHLFCYEIYWPLDKWQNKKDKVLKVNGGF